MDRINRFRGYTPEKLQLRDNLFKKKTPKLELGFSPTIAELKMAPATKAKTLTSSNSVNRATANNQPIVIKAILTEGNQELPHKPESSRGLDEVLTIGMTLTAAEFKNFNAQQITLADARYQAVLLKNDFKDKSGYLVVYNNQTQHSNYVLKIQDTGIFKPQNALIDSDYLEIDATKLDLINGNHGINSQVV